MISNCHPFDLILSFWIKFCPSFVKAWPSLNFFFLALYSTLPLKLRLLLNQEDQDCPFQSPSASSLIYLSSWSIILPPFPQQSNIVNILQISFSLHSTPKICYPFLIITSNKSHMQFRMCVHQLCLQHLHELCSILQSSNPLYSMSPQLFNTLLCLHHHYHHQLSCLTTPHLQATSLSPSTSQ